MVVLWLAVVAAGAGCTGGLGGSGGDDGFAEGRSTAPVWLIEPLPMVDNGAAERELLVEVFDWEYTDIEHLVSRGGKPWRARQYGYDSGADGGLYVYPLEGTWNYSGPGYNEDQFCRRCGAVPVGEEEAIERLRTLLSDLGLDTESFEYDAFSQVTAEGLRVDVAADAYLKIDGRVTSLRWGVLYGDTDGRLLAANGYFVDASELGDVPLFTEVEALQGAGRVPVEGTTTQIELGYETKFVRETGNFLMVPVYRVPVSAEFDLSVSIPATRRQDVDALVG